MLSVIFILFSLLVGVLTQNITQGPGQCPDIHLPTYDFSLVIGEWYQYKGSVDTINDDQICLGARLDVAPSGKFRCITNFFIPSLRRISTAISDIVLEKGLKGTFISKVPYVGRVSKPAAVLALNNQYIIIYSCGMSNNRRVESAWVYIRSPIIPPPGIDDRIKEAFSRNNLKMLPLSTNNFEQCSGIFPSYKLDSFLQPPITLLSCLFSPSCVSEKLRGVVTSLLPRSTNYNEKNSQ